MIRIEVNVHCLNFHIHLKFQNLHLMNVEALEDISSTQNFMESISQIDESLSPTYSQKFFDIIMKHFNFKLDQIVATAILDKIRVLINNEKHREAFIEGDFVIKLPFKRKELTEPLLELLYILIDHKPQCISEQVSRMIARLACRVPKKVLTLIILYSKSYEKVENPFYVLDILFNCESYFVNDCIIDYILTLGSISSEIKAFKVNRAKDIQNIVFDNLESEDTGVINACYSTLTSITEKNKNVQVPSDKLSSHIIIPECTESVIDYLIVAPLCDSLNHAKIVKMIIKHAQDDMKYSLILMKYAENPMFATLLAQYTKWLAADLPTPRETLRIFLVVFQHKDLRELLIESFEFLELMQSLIDMNEPVYFGLFTTILRRIDLNQELITRLSKANLLRNYFIGCDNSSLDEMRYNAFLLADTIVSHGFSKELIGICDLINVTISENHSCLPQAIHVAKNFLREADCVNRFKEIGLVDTLSKCSKSEKAIVKEIISTLSS